MKHFLFSLIVLSVVNASAGATDVTCPDLAGVYSCPKQNVDISQRVNGEGYTVYSTDAFNNFQVELITNNIVTPALSYGSYKATSQSRCQDNILFTEITIYKDGNLDKTTAYEISREGRALIFKSNKDGAINEKRCKFLYK